MHLHLVGHQLWPFSSVLAGIATPGINNRVCGGCDRVPTGKIASGSELYALELHEHIHSLPSNKQRRKTALLNIRSTSAF
jgi:hypothetical protein